MSSTDEARLREFFAERIVPAARKLRERGVQLFPLAPDAREETWYTSADPGEDFCTIDEERCGEALRELWEARNLPELAEIAYDFMELSRQLESAEEDTPDISPFVYVMY